MPFVKLAHLPLAGGPAEIYYREFGSGDSGVALVFLHGGWGYEIYPIDAQLDIIGNARVLIPDRAGYGRSTKPAVFGIDFHRRAAEERFRCSTRSTSARRSLGTQRRGSDRCSARAGLAGTMPGAGSGGLSLLSREARLARVLPGHGGRSGNLRGASPTCCGASTEIPYWRELLHNEGETWLELAAGAENGAKDLYQGRLSQLTVPVAFLHGASDPRTDPGELDEVRRQLPSAAMHIVEGAGHSPHSETSLGRRVWAGATGRTGPLALMSRE